MGRLTLPPAATAPHALPCLCPDDRAQAGSLSKASMPPPRLS